MLNDQFFTEVYKHSPIGLIILNEQTEIVDVNKYMFKFFSLNDPEYRGRKFGNVFGCSIVSEEGKVCGETEACLLCDLRGGVLSVLHKGTMIEDTTISHAFVTNHIHSLKWFKISASLISSDVGKYLIVSFADITKEKQYEEMLKHELTIDQATGTINKHNLMGVLMDLTKYAGNFDVLSVGIIDMDNFKDINDHFGHLKGDEVLYSFSELARQAIRKQDIIGRFGGEEFMFVFPGVKIGQAASIIQRIHNEFSAAFVGQKIQRVSFSAGFTELSISDLFTMTKEEIIESVDSYLYQAKQSGKRKFVSDHLTVLL